MPQPLSVPVCTNVFLIALPMCVSYKVTVQSPEPSSPRPLSQLPAGCLLDTSVMYTTFQKLLDHVHEITKLLLCCRVRKLGHFQAETEYDTTA